jgi:hypothetical protein
MIDEEKKIYEVELEYFLERLEKGARFIGDDPDYKIIETIWYLKELLKNV